jgi:BA14K-like protein
LAQNAHEPFLRRDVPPTAWHYDGRDDTRDFQNNGFFPGDFAAHPGGAWLGAAGLFGFTPSGGSQFGVIYCSRRYRSHNSKPGYFQGDDGVWYRCHR